MPRSPRIEFSNAWYHVMNRGAGRSTIFPSDETRQIFLEILADVCASYEVEIHAYCLMGNHFHLLIKTQHPNLNLAMQKLTSLYSRRHNKMVRRDGPLFKGRYKAILIGEKDYLARVSRYIHLNPVEAKLVVTPSAYHWSSYPVYCGLTDCPSWLKTQEVISQVSPSQRPEPYLSFVENPNIPSMASFYNSKAIPGVLGSKEVRRMFDSHAGYVRDYRPANRADIATIVKKVAFLFNEEFDSVDCVPAKGRSNVTRAVAMYLAQQKAHYSVAEVAAYFNVQNSAVTQSCARLKGKMARNPGLQKQIRDIEPVVVLA